MIKEAREREWAEVSSVARRERLGTRGSGSVVERPLVAENGVGALATRQTMGGQKSCLLERYSLEL